MPAESPKIALFARLQALPAPDEEEFQPTHFFRRLLEAQQTPIVIGSTGEIERSSLFADHQRMQHKLSDALRDFHQHRACHGIEFACVLAMHGERHARAYLADVAHWAAELHRMILPEASAVPAKRGAW